MARRGDFPIARLRWMFSTSTVASSTRMPTASASPPSVITSSVYPSASRHEIEMRIASGIEVATTIVLRHEPRKTRIIVDVKRAAMIASCRTFEIDACTNTDWSKSVSTLTPGGAEAWIVGTSAFTRSTTSRVDASPPFRMLMSAARWPSRRTMFVCTEKPSRTLATSRM
jgi:hypothetical protein